MAMQSLSMRNKLLLLAGLAGLLGVFALAWQLRQQHHQRAVAACRALRAEIRSFKADDFDVRLQEMRTMRLNPSQAEALRNAEPEAYARYAASFGELVDQVAQAADRLGEQVDQFQRQGCVDLR